jgi:carbonic anhydrase/acetyltransferase-like protein (isoleucine patch superfamily)
MPRVYQFDGVIPVIDSTAFVHPEAVLIGDVIVGPGCYVGPFASLRGDLGRILIGEGSNLQDGCVVHCFPGADTVLGRDVHVGHASVLHGCRLADGALVGMNSVVMDEAVVGERAFVGAQSLVPAGFEVPARWLAVGAPARLKRELTEEEMAWKANGTRIYQELAQRSLSWLLPAEPLIVPEPARRRVSLPTGASQPLHKSR